MSKNDRRLTDLENASSKPGGHAVLYADPDRPGEYTEHPPMGNDPGKRYTEAEKRVLADTMELVVVEYVRDWRPSGEDKAAFG